MSVIICATGPIDSGKSEFCNLLRAHEQSSIGFESSELITEIANECNRYLHMKGKKLFVKDNFFDGCNEVLLQLQQNHPDLLSGDITFSKSDLLEHPEQFEMLHAYLDTVKKQSELLTERITPENKDLYRPLLKWLGGYMVFKTNPTVWFDEIGRRISRFNPAPFIITVNALRYPTDEEAMRSFATAHGHQCIVVEVLRRGTKEGTDVTESSRHNIAVDIRVHNDGSLKDLEGLAARLLKDIKREKTASEYQAKQGLFGSIFG